MKVTRYNINETIRQASTHHQNYINNPITMQFACHTSLKTMAVHYATKQMKVLTKVKSEL
jgi:hypothetical protein